MSVSRALLPHVSARSLRLAVRHAVLSLALAGAAQPLLAADEARSYEIPSGPLGRALAAFASEAGVSLSFDPSLTEGLQSPGLSGSYSSVDGLNRLLGGNRLQLQRRDDGSYTLVRLADAADAVELPTSQVTGLRSRANELPVEYAGGQVARGGRLGMLGNADLMDAPFSITSYTAQTIRDQQARSVADVLANEPSAQIATARTGINEDFSLRGFPVYSADIALNGMYGLVPFYRVPVEMAERVEVLKGPSAMLNGMSPSGAVGGAVNLVTKRADADPLARVGVNYQSDSVLGTQVDLGRRFGEGNEFGVRFNGVYRDGDSIVDRQDVEARFTSLGLDYAGERLRLSADYVYQLEDFDSVVRQFGVAPTLTAIPDAPDDDPAYPGFGYSSMRDRTLMVQGEYDLTDWLTAYAGYGDRTSEMDAMTGNPTLLNEAGDFVSTPAWQVYDVYSHSAEAGLRANFDTGPVSHRLSLGATRLVQNSDIFFDFMTYMTSLRQSNLYHPVYSATPSTDGIAAHALRYTTATLTGYALADTLSVLDGRVALTLGVRRQRVEAQNYTMNVGTPSGEGYDERELTPLAGLVVKPWENISLYANYVEGLSKGDSAPITANNPGEMLAPYVTKQKEVGVKGEWDGFGASLAAFQIERPSSITENGFFRAGGEQRNRGLQLDLFGEVTPELRLLGGAAYTQARLTKTQGGAHDGNDAIGVPRKQLNLGGEWDLGAVPGLTLTARTIYTGEQYANQENTLRLPSWVRVDVGARYRFESLGKPVVLRANLDNLFDEDYWGTSTAGYLYLGAGRTLQLSASVDL